MIGFTVADMDRSVAFYSDVLGFEKVADFGSTDHPTTIWTPPHRRSRSASRSTARASWSFRPS
jgi:catechol 2,3-dioxygenase-like lactoylglutathione lyase family enzyme